MKTNKKRIIVKVFASTIVLVAIVLTSVFAISRNALAAEATNDNTVMNKTLVNAAAWCYEKGVAGSGSFNTPIATADYFGVTNAINAWGAITVPTNIGNTLNNSTLNCQQIFTGVNNKMNGLLSRYGKGQYDTSLDDLGYKNASGSSTYTYKCLKFQYYRYNPPEYDSGTGEKHYTNSVCLPVDSDGKVVIQNDTDVKTENEGNLENVLGSIRLQYSFSNNCLWYQSADRNGSFEGMDGMSQASGCLVHSVNGKNFSSVVSDISKNILDESYFNVVAAPKSGDMWKSVIYAPSSEFEESADVYNMSGGVQTADSKELTSTSFGDFMKWLTNNQDSSATPYRLSDNDFYYIYRSYVTKLQKDGKISINTSCSPENKNKTYAITYNGTDWCEVTTKETINEKFAVRQGGNSNRYFELGDFSSVMSGFKNFSYSNMDQSLLGGTVGGDISDPGDGSSDGTIDASEAGTISACYQGAGVLSWIVCPVLEAVGSATNWMYDNMIEPFLEVRASALFDGQDSLYTGWSTFRNFSNILFAIAFAVIILAQITGIGISNYNIKKILPRFIMVVVLVNISYILCQLAVDISNIVGSNIKELFEGFPVPGEANSFVDIGASLLNGLGLATGVGAVAIFTLSTAVASAGLAYVMIPILLTFLSCLLAIIFFFVILSARQVGIVILVVLSPIAIICYALPNTKSIFDKWKKLFMALILVYPICGLVMGGGNYVSVLLMGMVNTASPIDAVGIFFTITAMLASVLPFFLIPSILKSSMLMAGNLGAKISQFGRGFNGGLQRNIRNSRAFQEHQQQALRNYNMARNGRIMRRSELQDSEKRRLAELRNKGALTAGERREMRRLTDKEFRYVRAASARENALREEQKNTVAANRGVYDYGSQRYRSAQEGYNDEQRARDVAEQTALYRSGQVMATDLATGNETSTAIDVDNIDSLQNEHASLLNVVQQDTEGTNQIARARLEAVQNLLAAKQDKGLEAMYKNYVKMSSDDKYTDADLQSVGLKNAVRHLRDNYSGVIKKGNRGFDALLGNYQNNTAKTVHTNAVNNTLRSMLASKHVNMSSLAPNGSIDADSDIVRNAISSGVLTQADVNTAVENALEDDLAIGALSKYTAANLNDLHDDTLKRYVGMAERGRLDGTQLAQFSKVLNEGVASGTINLKGEVGESINNFLQAAYSTGAVARTSANAQMATAGSAAMQHASLESLQQISSSLQTGAISGPVATKIVENARRYMESGALIEPERAQELRQIINVAKAQGINSLAGPTDHFEYDETSFKVRGAPEKIQEVAYPPNMERTTRIIRGPQRRTEVIWQDKTTGQQITDQALIDQAEEAYRINQKVRERNHMNGAK